MNTIQAVSRGIFAKARSLACLFCVFLLLALTVFSYTRMSTPAKVRAATSSTLNFQARLLTSAGSTVPDGYYNLQFKLYTASTGGTAQWTDTRYDQNGATSGSDFRVRVVNGYFSVALGDTSNGGTAFPASINWDQEHWLTMNVGGSAQTASPTWDGEMSPRLKLTGVPYAFAAGQAANTKSYDTNAASTNSLGVSVQSGNALGTTSNSGNVTIDSGSATGTAGTISLGASNTSAITLGRTGITTTMNGSFLQSGTGTFGTASGIVSLNGATNIAATASLATMQGADYTTPGSANDVAISTASLYRLDTSGAAQVITGIAAGRNGQILTLVNADASLAVTISNQNASSLAANRITTGTGADLSLAAGASINLIYDSTASLWRVVGDAAGAGGGGGSCATCANQALSNLSAVNINAALNATGNNLTLQTTTSGNIILNAAGITDLQDNLSNSTGNLVLDDTVDIGSSANGIRIDTTGSILDINGDLVLNDQIQLGGAAGLQITTAGVITDLNDASVSIGENLAVTAGGITVTGNSTIAGTLGSLTGLASTGTVAFSGAGSFSIDSSAFDVTSGGAVSGVTGYSQTSGTFSASGGAITLNTSGTATTQIGNATGTFQLDSNTVDISTAGAISGLTGYAQASGNFLQSGTGTFGTGTGVVSLNGNTDVAATASLATKVGTTFTTAGTSTNAALNAASFYILDTASTPQVIQGITAGRDGQHLTLTNIDAQAVTLANDNVSATGARIITGTGADVSLTTGASATLIYDSANTRWRVVGSVAGGSGSCSTCANQSLSNLTSPTNINQALNRTSGDLALQTTTSGNITITPATATGLTNILTGNLKVGNGTPTVALDGEDAYIEGTLEVDGTSNFAGALTVVSGGITVTGNSTIAGTLGSLTGLASTGTVAFSGAGSFSIDSSAFDVSTGGALSGITGYAQTSGNFLQSGTGTFGTGTGAVSINGAATVANNTNFTVGTGAQFTNGSSTLLTAIAVGDTATNTDIGTAAATVNIATTINKTQTTAGRTLTLPTPTNTTAGRIIYVNSVAASTQNFTMYGVTITPNGSSAFMWNGAAWVSTGDGTGGTCSTCANQQLSNLAGTIAINTSLLTQGDNAIDLGSSANSFRTLYADTSVLTGAVDAAVSGALAIGNGGLATSVSICNAANCDTITIGTNADADTIQVGDATDTFTLTAGAASTFVINGVTIDATEFNRLNAKDAALVDTNDGVTTAITGTGTLDAGAISTNFGAIDVGTDNITTTGTVSGGIVNVSGTQFTNNGSTLNTAQQLGNFATGGSIGTAATTVDVDTTIIITQTTAGQTLSLPAPTLATAGRIVYVSNIGAASFTMHGVVIGTNNSQTYIWNGSAWTPSNVDGAGTSGVTTIGSLDGQTRNANGATISGNSLYLQTADGTNPGLVSTGIQSFGGNKTFNGTVTVGAAGTALSVTNNADIGGTLFVGTADAFQVSAAGAVTAVGVNSGAGLLQGTAGLTLTGATSINTSGTAVSSIGNASGSLTLTGSSASTFVLNGVTVDATEFNRLDGKDAALVDANDSLSSTFGTIDTGDTITGTTINGTTGINTGTSAGTQRIDASGNLVNIGNLTATGAITITSTGASNNIILNSANTIELQDATNITGNLDVTGSVAFRKGTDYATVGTTSNVNFGEASLIRLTGASAQTITGITGGRDGEILTIINAAAQGATLTNNDAASLAANRIVTGTGANLSMPAGSSAMLIYDSGASVWRLSGISGSCSTCANQQLSNLSGTVAVNMSLLTQGDNAIDLGSAANSWRTLYADTSVLTPSVDVASGALSLGTGTASAISIGRTGVTTTNNGTLTVTQTLNANGTGKTAISIADSGAQTSGITIGGDTNLYRNSANWLWSDDRFASSSFLEANGASANVVTLGWNGTAQAAAMTFGSTYDTNLYRSNANELKTDDTFIAGAGLQVTAFGDPATGTYSGTKLMGGNNANYSGNNQLTFGYSGAASYQHAIKTRHHGGAQAGNAIDFYTWNYGTDAIGTVGTKHLMTLDGNGNVGINSTAPTSKLHVVGSTAFTLPAAGGADVHELNSGYYSFADGGAQTEISKQAVASTTKWRVIFRGTFVNNWEGSGLAMPAPYIEATSASPAVNIGALTLTISRNGTTGKLQGTTTGGTAGRVIGFNGTIEIYGIDIGLAGTASMLLQGSSTVKGGIYANNITSYDNTGGNLHLDGNNAIGTDHAVYLNYYGNGGTKFGNGAGTIVATMSSAGVLTTNGRIFSGAAGSGGIWVDGGSQQFIGSADVNNIGIYNGGAWALQVSNAGNVNIGNGLSGRRLDVYNTANNGDGLAIGQDTDNTQTIQGYIDGQWTNRTTYAGGCCNLLKLQPDVGAVQLGASLQVSNAGVITSAGTYNGQTISSTANFTGSIAVAGLLNLGGTISNPHVGTNSNLTGNRYYEWGYQAPGAWSGTFPDLVLGYHTGVSIGAHTGYGGTRFFNDHPSVSTTEIFSVGNGDNDVRVTNNLRAGAMSVPTITYVVCNDDGGGYSAFTPSQAYTVVAVDASGNTTTASAAASLGGCAFMNNGSGSFTVGWTAVPGATSYRVYKNNAEYFVTYHNSYNDYGSIGAAGSAPTTNTAYSSRLGPTGNSWIGSGKLYVTDGNYNYWNNSAASVYVSRDINTSRSINAAGSINATGADYAEWIPWSGAKPDAGSIVTYKGSSFVVSSKDTAAFVGNDVFTDESKSLLVTFAGQVPVKVTGAVNEGDLLVPAGDGTARAVNPASASLGEILSQLGISQETNTNPGVKKVKATIGSTSSNLSNPQQAQTLDSLNVTGSTNLADLNVSGATTLTNLTVTGDANIQGKLTVKAIEVGNITVNGHIITAGDTPTGEVLGATGIGATVSIDGNDTAGTVTITTGNNGISAGGLTKITFNKAFGKTPRIVLTGQDENSLSAKIHPTAKSTTHYILKTSQVLVPNTAYTYDYFIVE